MSPRNPFSTLSSEIPFEPTKFVCCSFLILLDWFIVCSVVPLRCCCFYCTDDLLFPKTFSSFAIRYGIFHLDPFNSSEPWLKVSCWERKSKRKKESRKSSHPKLIRTKKDHSRCWWWRPTRWSGWPSSFIAGDGNAHEDWIRFFSIVCPTFIAHALRLDAREQDGILPPEFWTFKLLW